jgi:hypothetical protein
MSTLLVKVDWSRYITTLVGYVDDVEHAPPIMARAGVLSSSPLNLIWPRHVALALVLAQLPGRLVRNALGEVAQLSLTEGAMLAVWLDSAAIGVLNLAESYRQPALQTVASSPGALRLEGVARPTEDATPAPLPLLALCDDIARTTGLAIVVDLDQTRAGRYDTETRIVYVNPTGEAFGRTIAEVFAHELGHALDPHFGRQFARDNETFADALGALLLAEQPRTLAEAGPLIIRANERVPHGEDFAELPATAVDTLAAFLALPV